MFRIRRQHVVISRLRKNGGGTFSQPAKHIPNGLQGTLPNWFGLKTRHFWCFFLHRLRIQAAKSQEVLTRVLSRRCLHPHLDQKIAGQNRQNLRNVCLKVEYPKTYPLVNHPKKRWPFFMAYKKSILRPKHHVSGWVNFTLVHQIYTSISPFYPLAHISHVFAGLNIYLLIASAI